MSIKYYLQKLFGLCLYTPIIPNEKTVGFSLVRSEKYNCSFGIHTKIVAPFYLHEVELGNYSYISKNSNISNTTIGKFCSIGPNFCCGLGIHPTNGISTSPMFYSTAKQNGISLSTSDKVEESKKTLIGNDVFIGANVSILDGVIVSDGAVIGAGAVVTNDIPPYAIAVGVPAKVVKYRFPQKTIDSLIKKEWWNASEAELSKVEEFFFDIDGFLSE